jgi:predicted DNA-binding transcriptional regulator YafY
MDTLKAVRMLKVWALFSDGRTHKARVVADVLRVSTKTIMRDVELLRDLGCDFASNRRGQTISGLRLVSAHCPCCNRTLNRKPITL